MDKTIDIIGLDKCKLFVALYNKSRVQGLGMLAYVPGDMRVDEVKTSQVSNYVDYVNGRVMKIDLSGDVIDPWGYDRDNGEGAVKKIVDAVRLIGLSNEL